MWFTTFSCFLHVQVWRIFDFTCFTHVVCMWFACGSRVFTSETTLHVRISQVKSGVWSFHKDITFYALLLFCHPYRYLSKVPIRTTPNCSSVRTEICSTRRKPVVLGRIKPGDTRLISDQGNLKPTTAHSQNQTLVEVIKTPTLPGWHQHP